MKVFDCSASNVELQIKEALCEVKNGDILFYESGNMAVLLGIERDDFFFSLFRNKREELGRTEFLHCHARGRGDFAKQSFHPDLTKIVSVEDGEKWTEAIQEFLWISLVKQAGNTSGETISVATE